MAGAGGLSLTGGAAGTGTGGFAATAGNLMITAGSSPVLDAGDDSGFDAGSCATLSVETVEIVPTVVLVVDTSSSMFDPRASLWDPLYNALMAPTTGVVASLQDKVRFGFVSYKSVTRPTLDPTCPLLQTVTPKMMNFTDINTQYAAAGVTPTGDYKWETPTGASVAKVAADLAAFVPVPPGPKFMLLVTDGNPDTCQVRDPQCGADESIKAVQDAYAMGIGTFVIGIGEILTNNAGCVGRCGLDHLQDLANAGSGQPVMMNTNEYGYQQCTGQPTNEKATYSAAGGTAKYYTVSTTGSSTTDLSNAILQSLVQTRSCTFAMTATVPGGGVTGVHITTNAQKGMFSLSGTPLGYNDPNGWTLTPDQTGITLNGTACNTWKTAGGTLTGSFPCDVMFDPVPPPPPPK